MTDNPESCSAAAYLPERLTLPSLRRASQSCKGCDLYRRATQTVFGEGSSDAAVMFIGEQPGDHEDRSGKPFVGPAGRLLDKALKEVGISRKIIYVTNAVKHFKWTPRGKRRIHEKPRMSEIEACRPWLESEIEIIKPQVIVCLGATAARALMGPKFRVTKSRGELLDTHWAPRLMATVHPSSLLRAPTSEQRKQAYQKFVRDLQNVAEAL